MGDDKPSHEAQKFRTQIGVNATVDRRTVGAEQASRPNTELAKLGLACQPSEHVHYLGSAAIHIYANEILNQVFFVSQTQPLALYKCPQELASKGFDDLLQSMKQMYGHRRQKLRSGF